MHNIKTNFDKILEVMKDILGDEINEKGNYVQVGIVKFFWYSDALVEQHAFDVQLNLPYLFYN